MLVFKRKFLDLIRSGQKTQTLRIWKSLRVRVGQKEMIPGIGPIWIDAVDQVTFDDLTDEDAMLDGFQSVALLQEEIRIIYGDEPEGTLYRVRFHLIQNSSDENEQLPAPEPVAMETVSPTETRKPVTRKVLSPTETQGHSKPLESPQNSEFSNPETSEVKKSVKTEADCKGFVNKMRQEFAEKMGNFFPKKESTAGPSEIAQNSVEAAPKETPEPPKNHVRLTEEQVVEKMIRRCRINRNVCDWNHEPGKSQDFFALFMQAPRNERGIPVLDGYRLRSLMRDQTSENEWEEICWIASEVCAAWTEWQYALAHWEKDGNTD